MVITGTAAPAGGNYSGLVGDPVLNGGGQVAFSANLTGGTATVGIFVGGPGAVGAVAPQGQAAPGGDTFAGFTGRR